MKSERTQGFIARLGDLVFRAKKKPQSVIWPFSKKVRVFFGVVSSWRLKVVVTNHNKFQTHDYKLVTILEMLQKNSI